MSPIPDTMQSILDVGCGTGVWAIHSPRSIPVPTSSAQTLSLVRPDYVLPNCEFLSDNGDREWAFMRKFDFIHARMPRMGIHDWPRFLQQCWDNGLNCARSLSPGPLRIE
ncbi:hypothetical protein B0J12DRAFT_110201 [Macrophomina phaseolina]|uniref:Methyltransferase type 11 n=1 Tax=Macrophomina phaseolina TaxID=35725 RepID=A0ABQ8G8H7_9PEZI|nr:hypothetical protein B0J12DRAFT_110201 [Macrophomina phaseolina]